MRRASGPGACHHGVIGTLNSRRAVWEVLTMDARTPHFDDIDHATPGGAPRAAITWPWCSKAAARSAPIRPASTKR